MGPSVIRTVEIVNAKGLHARASRKLAELACRFDARVRLRHDGDEADATSLMDLMMLGAGVGSVIEVEAVGSQALDAVEAISTLIANRFGEGE